MANKMTSSIKGQACWSAPSNIALVKYWGKRPVQLPGNASLSLTLDHSRTTVEATWMKAENFKLNFSFEGMEKPAFAKKVEQWILSLSKQYPLLNNLELNFKTSNTFPHSAGIASSASSMAAMALVLGDILNLRTKGEDEWLKEVSNLARLGSGSAARSLFSHAASWGHEHNEWASGIKQMHEMYRDFGDAILIVDSGVKAVSSREGHALMQNHPFRELRYENANKRVVSLIELLQKDDFEAFSSLVELEALELHALMMTSIPSFILMKPKTLELIDRIRKARAQGLELCFTLDAGPNIHLLYPKRARQDALKFVSQIKDEGLLEAGQWIDDRVGTGPRKES